MRFRATIHNSSTFAKFTASLASLGNIAWVRLSSDDVRFTIIPERGTQVWSQLTIDTIFEYYTIQSATANNAINMEIPLAPLLRALRSASQAKSASIRLTKKDGIPWLCMTIVSHSSGPVHTSTGSGDNNALGDPTANANNTYTDEREHDSPSSTPHPATNTNRRERETIITQDIPVRVMSAAQVASLHEPRCRDPDVHIYLPPLQQLKAISDRFTRLALNTSDASTSTLTSGANTNAYAATQNRRAPRLELSATMHGSLRLALRTESLRIASTWRGLMNPELDPRQVDGGEEGVRAHPSTRMREMAVVDEEGADGDDGEDGEGEGGSRSGWAKVRIDARDWSKVLSCGRVGGKVVACFCHDHALILYVYLPGEETDGVGSGGDESVLTYYISSYSA